MKTIKILFACLFAIALGAGVSAFTKADVEKPAKKTEVSYHYTSNSNVLADMKDIENWEVATPGCDEEGNRPCVILYEGDLQAFEAYLQAFSTVSPITERADEKKTVQ